MLSKVKRYLRIISVGKYQTTLYNKSGDFYKSSVIGGLITLLLIVLFGTMITYFLTVTIKKDHYDMESQEQILNGYLEHNGTFSTTMTTCQGEICRDFKIRDLPTLLEANLTL